MNLARMPSDAHRSLQTRLLHGGDESRRIPSQVPICQELLLGGPRFRLMLLVYAAVRTGVFGEVELDRQSVSNSLAGRGRDTK